MRPSQLVLRIGLIEELLRNAMRDAIGLTEEEERDLHDTWAASKRMLESLEKKYGPWPTVKV